jgi:predicted kinase
MEDLVRKLSGFKLIIVCGLPGTGKTTIAKRLASKMGAEYLSTDDIRVKELFQKTSRFDRGNVSQEKHVKIVRKKVYRELARRAKRLLKKEKSVILDGTFLDERRDEVYEELKQYAEKSVMVVVRESKKMIRSRIAKSDIEKWEREAYVYWEKALRKGKATYPKSDGKVSVVEVNND